MADLFERLDQGRPAPIKETQGTSPEQKLLDWLQRWPRSTVSWRDIHNQGPNSIRNQKIAIAAAGVLVQNGWLTPLKGWRYDMHKWQIVRRPPIVAPKVSM